MQDVTPFIEQELAEHAELAAVLADRVEILERVAALARQLDALTHRALALKPDLEISTPPAPAAPAAAPKAPTAEARRKATGQAKPAAAKPKAARTPPADPQQVMADLLAYVRTQDEPRAASEIREAIGYSKGAIYAAIERCNGQLATIDTNGPRGAVRYMAAENAPAWTAPGADDGDGQAADDEPPQLPADEVEAAYREAEAEPGDEPAAAPPPPVSPRVARELARESEPGHAAGDHQDVEPQNLDGKVLRMLQDNGGMRVRAIADALSEDPAVVAKVVSDHVRAGNVRKNPADASYYAVAMGAAA